MPRRGYTLGIAVEAGKGPEGRPTLRPAVRIFDRTVHQGPTLRELVRKIAPDAHVEYVGRVKAAIGRTHHQRRHDPLRIGVSIGHHLNSSGTAGAFAKWKPGKGDAKDVLVLSCAHVLAFRNATSADDSVIQPGTSDSGRRPDDVIGKLEKFIELQSNASNVVDAAIARLDDSRKIESKQLTAGRRLEAEPRPIGDVQSLTDVPNGVYKVGRSTGCKFGRLTAVGFDLPVEYENQPFRSAEFSQFYEFKAEPDSPGGPFAKQGDSGALVVDGNGKPIAMIIAVSPDEKTTFAIPIGDVLNSLNIDLSV
jgi:hypothetical protein